MSWFTRADAPTRPVNWKFNLGALWLSQFLTLSAFYFCLPFLPLYLEQNGIVPKDEVEYWSGLFIAAAPICMMIASPIWGMLGDRFGRKMMLVRATLSGAFVLYLMGVVGNIEGLLVLRMMQGAFTGTIPAAQSLAAAGTPHDRQGLAIGMLMAAVNAGNTVGPYFGGICAKHYGGAATFKIAGFMLLAATLLVMFMVKENFARPELPTAASRSARIRQRRDRITSFTAGIPVLAGITYVAFLQTYDGPFLSLYVAELFRNTPQAVGLTEAAMTGEAFAITGRISAYTSIAAIAGSLAVGALMDRKLSTWIWPAIALLGGVGAAWIHRDNSLFGLAAGRTVFFLFNSCLASALVVLLSRMTPNSRKGAAIGWSVAARSIGWALAPVMGALLAKRLGYVSAFGFLAACGLFFCVFFIYMILRYKRIFVVESDEPPSLESIEKDRIATPGGQGRVG